LGEKVQDIKILAWKPQLDQKRELMGKYKKLEETSTVGKRVSDRPNRRKLWKWSVASILAVLAFALLLNLLAPRPSNNLRSDELLFVGVLHRHGARMGLHQFTFENFSWPLHLGALTQEGMNQGFTFGKHLRSIYGPQMSGRSATADVTALEVMSTNYSRTQDTVHSVLLGLFSEAGVFPDLAQGDCSCRPDEGGSPSDVECVSQCLGLASIPPEIPRNIEVLDPSNIRSSLLLQASVCEGHPDWKQKWMQSDEYQIAENTTFLDQIKTVEKIVGGKAVCKVSQFQRDATVNETLQEQECYNVTLHVVEEVWDSAVCANASGIPYPASPPVQETTVNKLKKAVQWMWHHIYSKEQGPSVGGILLEDIIHRMSNAAAEVKSKHRKIGKTGERMQGASMTVYSAHDTTVASLLAALGHTDWILPGFLSHVVVELWGQRGVSTPSNLRVQIKYNDAGIGIDGCPETGCSMSEFVTAVAGRHMPMKNCTLV